MGDWINPVELFRSQDFLALYKHPFYYQEVACAYFRDPACNEQQKRIIVYGLEGLPIKNYITFVKACYALYADKKLSEEIFSLVLHFEFLWLHPLIRGLEQEQNNSSKVVTHFLVDLQKKVGSTTPIGKSISCMVSGELLKKWRSK